MFELEDAVKQCVERVTRFRRQHQRIGEQNTKVGLIEPIIGALGWDLFDPDEVHREYRRRGRDNPVDYALLLLRTPRLFIEAKGLGENLDDPRWANQTISYATVAGVEWVALTDGAEWRVYNAHAPVPIEHKLFRAVRLEQDMNAAADLLSLLSKDNMRENRIEELWKGFFVDRQVHAELLELFAGNEPAADLVALLDRRLSKLSRDEIRSSLMRARASFDFPSAAAPLADRPAPAPAATAPARLMGPRETSVQPRYEPPAVVPDVRTPHSGPRRPGKQRVSSEERRLHLPDMIDAGRLRPGCTLVASYFGKQYQAELLPDGTIRYRGQVYNSPSGAGEAVKIFVHGPSVSASTKATDGWDFWHTEDARTGEVVSLKEIRRRTLADLSV
ncbi:restriction system modified-DNA reader domain-containing protein [Micromonospora chersina]